MIMIGNYNKLKIVRKADFGFFLDAGSGKTSDDILLPNKSANNLDLQIGDEVDAFIYRDSKDRIIATLKRPLAKVGEIAYLKVITNTGIGSFISFGLEKDILVPMKEKMYPLLPDKYYLFYIYLDKTGRIAATTDIDRHLQTSSPYKVGDTVKGTVYGFQTNKSASVAVDNLYKGVILKNEYFDELHPGETLELTVNKIHEEGRLGLTPRKTARVEVSELQEVIIKELKSNNGFIPFNDKSSPEDIYKVFHTSKNYFKQALGGLMKRAMISQDQSGTRLK